MFRKSLSISLWVFSLGLILVYMAGPRVSMDETIHPVSLPQDLEIYLANQENRFDDIITGTEKTIIWAGEKGAQTDFSIVYIHGFSATRQETAPLAEIVAKRLGANLFYTRMTGHGRTGAAMLEGSVNRWLNDTVQAFEIGKRIGRKIIMMGVSTGATAVTWLAAQPHLENLAACILMSPNFGPADPKAGILTWPWGEKIAEMFIGKERSWQADNQAQDRYWTNRYPTAALLPMMGLVKLVRKMDLDRIQVPMLVLHSPDDHVVSPKAIEKAFAAMGSPRKTRIPFTLAQDPDQHVLAGDILSPGTTGQIADTVYGFIVSDK